MQGIVELGGKNRVLPIDGEYLLVSYSDLAKSAKTSVVRLPEAELDNSARLSKQARRLRGGGWANLMAVHVLVVAMRIEMINLSSILFLSNGMFSHTTSVPRS